MNALNTRWIYSIAGALLMHLGLGAVIFALNTQITPPLTIHLEPNAKIGLSLQQFKPTPTPSTTTETVKPPPVKPETVTKKPIPPKPAQTVRKQSIAQPVQQKPITQKKTPSPEKSTPQPITPQLEYTKDGLPIVSDAEFYFKTTPKYPRRALQRGQEGQVIIDATIDETGGLKDIAVHQSSGFKALDNSAIQAIKRWRFKPFSHKGERQQAVIRVPVQFALKKPHV